MECCEVETVRCRTNGKLPSEPGNYFVLYQSCAPHDLAVVDLAMAQARLGYSRKGPKIVCGTEVGKNNGR